MNKIAVIDLGTNTFHLLIVEIANGHFKELYREKRFVGLALDGIEKISPPAYKRAFDALKNYKSIIDDFKVESLTAIGTAGLRTATNGQNFILEVKDKLDLNIELIDGAREAQLISTGVGLLIKDTQHKQLIMDIGGGSVEFILKEHDQVIWSQSFPIGVAVLRNKFHKNDPITNNECLAIEAYLNQTLKPLWSHIKPNENIDLIGASGTFDVLDLLLKTDKIGAYSKLKSLYFHNFYKDIIVKTKAERLKIKGMPENRVELIVVALILINTVLNNISIKDIYISHYALKEGIIAEYINKEPSKN